MMDPDGFLVQLTNPCFSKQRDIPRPITVIHMYAPDQIYVKKWEWILR